MFRIVAFPMLFIFLFSMACMGQTFQYSRGWTNGKRAGGTAATLNNLFYKDNEGLSELFDVPDGNGRRLEKCLLQLQRFIRNPLILHSSAGAAGLTINPSSAQTRQNGNGNSNNNNNMNSIPYGRSHQSNELFEELGAGVGGAIIDTNDYAKH